MTLEWDAPPECPTSASVFAEVMRIVENRGMSHRVQARATVARTSSGRWKVVLRTRADQSTGERTVEADTCETLAGATALIVALAVNSTRALRTPTQTPTHPESSPPTGVPTSEPTPPTPTPVPAPVPAPTQPPLPASLADVPAPPARQSHSWAIAASFAGGLGALPRPGLGAGFALAWMPKVFRIRAEVEVSLWAPQTAVLADRPAEGGQFALLSGDARLCSALLQTRLELSPCGVFEVDRTTASGKGADTLLAGDGVWSLVGVGILGAVRVTPEFAVRLSLDVLAPLARPEFVILGGGTVHKVAAIAARGGFGLEARFF